MASLRKAFIIRIRWIAESLGRRKAETFHLVLGNFPNLPTTVSVSIGSAAPSTPRTCLLTWDTVVSLASCSLPFYPHSSVSNSSSMKMLSCSARRLTGMLLEFMVREQLLSVCCTFIKALIYCNHHHKWYPILQMRTMRQDRFASLPWVTQPKQRTRIWPRHSGSWVSSMTISLGCLSRRSQELVPCGQWLWYLVRVLYFESYFYVAYFSMPVGCNNR